MRLITVAIHTYERALSVKALLEAEGIQVTLQNVNLDNPEVASGVRIRIDEKNLPLALRILENPDIFAAHPTDQAEHGILVPTDFTEHAYNAALIAASIASAHKLNLTFVNAYIGPHLSDNIQLTNALTYEFRESALQNEIISSAKRSMQQWVDRFKADIKNGIIPPVRFSTKIAEGVPEEIILDEAKETQPFMLVMGTRSAARKEKELIGSVSAEVLDSCRFPVLTFPEGDYKFTSPSNILFFSNLDQEDMLALDALYRIFPQAKAHVVIVSITSRRRFGSSEISANALTEYCRKHFEQFTFSSAPVKLKTASDEVAQLQTSNHFDLVVVANRRKSAFSRMLNPGLAHRLLFQTDLPLLMIPV